MKLTCKHPGCKTVIQMGDYDGVASDLAVQMAKHVSTEHDTVEVRHATVLESCRSAFFVIASGGKITPRAAKHLHDQISELVKGPAVKLSAIEGEKQDASISAVSVVNPPVVSDSGEKDVPSDLRDPQGIIPA